MFLIFILVRWQSPPTGVYAYQYSYCPNLLPSHHFKGDWYLSKSIQPLLSESETADVKTLQFDILLS